MSRWRRPRWWRRNGRRFVAGSVSGWAITPYTLNVDGRVPTNRDMPKVWYVYDAAFGYAIVAEIHGAGSRARAKEKANELADQLEADYKAWKAKL